MDEQDVTHKTTDNDPRKLSLWLVAAGILGVVLLGLLGAFALDRRFRQTVTVEPPRPLAALVPTSASPTQTPVATPGVTTTPVSSSAATPMPGITPTLPGGLRLADSPLEREVQAAYLRYWDVLTEANLSLDTSRLPEVTAGRELAQAQQQVEELKGKGKAAKVDVEHRIALAKVTPDEAVVADEYLNKSVYVDPVTKAEFKTTAPPTVEKLSFTLRKIDGQWKVVEAVRHD